MSRSAQSGSSGSCSRLCEKQRSIEDQELSIGLADQLALISRGSENLVPMLHLVGPEGEGQERDWLVRRSRLGRMDEMVAEDDRLAQLVIIFGGRPRDLLVE